MPRNRFRRGGKSNFQTTYQPKDTKPRSHLLRVNVLYGITFLSLSSLIFRLGYLQVVEGSSFRAKEQTTSAQTIPMLPARGRIYDANGNLLAYDKPVFSVFYTQQTENNAENVSSIAKVLAPEFHTTAAKIAQTIQKQSEYSTITLFKNINTAQLAFVTEHQSELLGVSVGLDEQREYPYGTLAGQVLGYIQPINAEDKDYYVNQKGYLLNQKVGVAGLEKTYENLLQGTPGKQVSLGYAGMEPMYSPPPTAGDNLQLTLDGHLQAVTQNAVIKEVTHSKNASQITDAAAVALDVKTGGVLAMVSYPYLDPNWYTTPGLLSKYSSYLATSGAQMNNVIQNPNDPGSTMKPSTLIAGLTYGAIKPTTTFDSQGILNVDGQREKDDYAFGIVNPVRAITVSSEIYFYQVGLHLGHWFGSTISSPGGTGGIPFGTWEKKYFWKGLLEMFHTEWEFGLGPKTGIDLPNEEAGKFFNEDGNKGFAQVQIDLMKIWDEFQKTGSYKGVNTPVSLVQAATGQMQQFTPIQLAKYVATIANDGVPVQPHLLQAVYPPGMSATLDTSQKPLQSGQPKPQKKLPFKTSYIKLAQQGMKGVIEDPHGTAYSAFVGAPYTAAGKTGTAEIGYHGRIVDNAVFIAYAPYDHPQIAVAVMVPGAGYGGTSGAAVARTIIDTYFKEHHEYFKNSQFESTDIPANWTSTQAYKVPESKKSKKK